MRWVLDQDDLDAPSMAARLDELRAHVNAVPVRRTSGTYDVLVEVDPTTGKPTAPPPVVIAESVPFH